MSSQENFVGKQYDSSIDTPEDLIPVAHALASEIRLMILAQINDQGLNINEIARVLNLPLSTVALNVKVLEKAGLVYTDVQSGIRGQMKVCYRRIDSVHFDLLLRRDSRMAYEQIEVPVGCYMSAGDIQPTCGFADLRQFSAMDSPDFFYDPSHFNAQLLWFREGYVEYHLPKKNAGKPALAFLEISFEACSEAQGYKNDWPSNIYVSINDQVIGLWRCPGDFGGRPGILTPSWWPEYNTQYGRLTTWRVNDRGTWLDKEPVSNVTLDRLRLAERDFISLRIGVGKEANHAGGLNLFGKCFGDYAQDIIVRYGYTP